MITIDDPRIARALRSVLDPELGVGILDLGLVYGVDRLGDGLRITMTTTSPACPLTGFLREEVVASLRHRVPELTTIDVAIVHDPPWRPQLAADWVREQLGLPG